FSWGLWRQLRAAGHAEGKVRSRESVPAEPERPSEGVSGSAQRTQPGTKRSPRGGEVDIGQWLRGLGLQSYEQAFRDNGIDFEVLPRLTVDDLKEMGVQAVGHRRKIIEAISLLRQDRTEGRPSPSVERRQLTIMFVD